MPLGLSRSLGPLAVVLVLLAGAPAVRAQEDDREVPPERLTVEELNRRAHESTDRVPIGTRTAGAARLTTSSLTWSALGPTPITGDYWSNYNNAAGRVAAIIVHPTTPSTAYLAAAGGGVWKTTNGGAGWTVLTDGLSSIASGALAFDPANANTIYYATGEQHYSGDSYYGDGLFRSLTAGGVWTKIGSRAQVGSYLARVLVSPTNANVILVAGDLGVIRTTDGGTSWSAVLSGGSSNWCNDLVMDPSSSAVLYASIYGVGIYKSANGGNSWTLLAGGLPTTGFQRINLAIAPSNGQVLYASFVNPSGGLLGMYRTSDGGTTWVQLAATPNYLRTQGWYDNTLIVSPSNANVVFAGGVFPYGTGDTGVITTSDGGLTWTDVTRGIDGSQVHPDQHILAFGSDGRLWLGNDGGVYTTTDGGLHWSDRNTNLNITQFFKIGVHPTDVNQIVGGTQDNGTLRYAGSTLWPQLVAGDGGPCGYEWDSPNIFYSTYVTMQNLDRWNAGAFEADVTGPWLGAGDRASFLNGGFAIDPNIPNTLLVGTYRVYRSTTSGAAWTLLSPDLTNGGVLRCVTVAPGAPNTIYAGSTDGVVSYTTDAVNWVTRSTGLPAAFIPDISVSLGDPKLAYTCARVPTGARVFRTVDAGLAWNDITGDLPVNAAPHAMVVDFQTLPFTLYVGTDYGLYSSVNGGVNWVKEAAIPNVAIFDLQLDGAGNLVVSTHGRGMWRAQVRSVVGVAEAARGEALALRPVAPDPARAPVAIAYRLEHPGAAALEIFDLMGRRVASLVSGVQEAGVHEARRDGRDAAGVPARGSVYLYRLRAEGIAETRRFVLLK